MINTILESSEQIIRETYRRMIFIKPKYFQDFIFIHINKTGGSSIEKALGLSLVHKKAIDYKNDIGETRWNDRFSFSFVRNPWDKVVSMYHYRTLINANRLGKNPIEFNDWIKLVYIDKTPYYYDIQQSFAPQMEWLTDTNGEVLVDFVGRFENFQNEWRVVCEKLNRTGLELPHVKKTPRTDYRSYYTQQSKQVIADWYARDIKHFGYKFD